MQNVEFLFGYIFPSGTATIEGERGGESKAEIGKEKFQP
jgi:hypothetical protein